MRGSALLFLLWNPFSLPSSAATTSWRRRHGATPEYKTARTKTAQRHYNAGQKSTALRYTNTEEHDTIQENVKTTPRQNSARVVGEGGVHDRFRRVSSYFNQRQLGLGLLWNNVSCPPAKSHCRQCSTTAKLTGVCSLHYTVVITRPHVGTMAVDIRAVLSEGSICWISIKSIEFFSAFGREAQ